MVVSSLPHHVTQRGNRREPIFFEDGDQEIYRDLLGEQARKADVEVWAYCLMPNHVHLILNPRQADGLGRAVGEAHRRYTNFINARGRWTGHLFQMVSSCPSPGFPPYPSDVPRPAAPSEFRHEEPASHLV